MFLRATGVQHPAPTLFCTCNRNEKELVVEAPYAQVVLGAKNITAEPPRTEIWALLYAQVRQADGKEYTVKLESLDDQYQPGTTGTNAQRLVQKEGAVVVFIPHSGGIKAAQPCQPGD